MTKFPHIWLDESYFSNPAYNLAAMGTMGTTMCYGFYNIANYTYWQPPVYILLLASSFKIFGFGLIQGRMVSVLLGLITVIFTFLLSNVLYNKKVAVIASLFLISNPLFFFVCREIRMDIAVICFGLMAIFFIFIALRRSSHVYYFLAGLFSALALLSHLNGLISIVTVLFIIILFKIDLGHKKLNLKSKEILYLILGIIIPLIPYLIYINLDFSAFLGQLGTNVQINSSIMQNIVLEPSRYFILLQYIAVSLDDYYNEFLILSLILISLTLYYNLYKKRNFNGIALILIILIQIAFFALIISRKSSYWYLGIMLPFWSILLASPFNGIDIKQKIPLKPILAILLIIGYISLGFYGIYHLLDTSKDYKYRVIESIVHNYIPKGSTIIGPGDYWINLQKNYTYYDFRRFQPDAVKEYHVNYILYDRSWRGNDEMDFKSFIKENCTFIGEIRNSNVDLSPILIYRVN